MQTTRLSTQGQIVLPKNIIPESDLEEVAGCLRSNCTPKTVARMNAANEQEVIRRHDRGRY
jgi:hypothetical protein